MDLSPERLSKLDCLFSFVLSNSRHFTKINCKCISCEIKMSETKKNFEQVQRLYI